MIFREDWSIEKDYKISVYLNSTFRDPKTVARLCYLGSDESQSVLIFPSSHISCLR